MKILKILFLFVIFKICYSEYFYDYEKDPGDKILGWTIPYASFEQGEKSGLDKTGFCNPLKCYNGECVYAYGRKSESERWCACDNGYFGDNCLRTQPVVMNYIPTDISGGNVIINGYFMDYQLYNITIENMNCKIISINQTTIICNINRLKNYEPVSFNITQELITWYDEYRPIPICKNNGKLSNDTKKCQCGEDHIGYDCTDLKPVKIIEMQVNPNANGGYLRMEGYFGIEPEKLKFMVNSDEVVQIKSINKTILEGFVGSNRNSYTIYSDYLTAIDENGKELCVFALPYSKGINLN